MPLWIQVYRRVLDQRELPGHFSSLMRFAAQSGTHPQAVIVEKTGKFRYVADGVSAVDEYSIDTTTGNLTLLASPNSTVAAGHCPDCLDFRQYWQPCLCRQPKQQ